MKRVYTYRIDPDHLPSGASACILWALTQWSKASQGKLQFFQATQTPEIIFSGAKSPEDFKLAWCQALDENVFSITFDPDVPWATTWLQRTFTQRKDFRKLSLHEIGHVLLGMNHSTNQDSIMFYAPKWPEIDAYTKRLLLQRL